MPKVESMFVTLTHPLPKRGQEMIPDLIAKLEHEQFMFHGINYAQGSIEELEFRKTLDYTRAERRAAKKSGQALEFNAFKNILPDGYTPILPDDPRLQAIDAEVASEGA